MTTRRGRSILILVLLLTANILRANEFATVDPARVGFDAAKLAKIEATMQEKIDAGKLVGGMGLVARGDKIVFAKTWGQRDREKQIPMSADTIFLIYSMTKPVTSVAAMTLIDAMTRFQPGALGDEGSALEDSFSNGLLHSPEYTRPQSVIGQDVPEVLLSGDHEAIRKWRLKQSLGATWLKRPDLLEGMSLNVEQKELLEQFKQDYVRSKAW